MIVRNLPPLLTGHPRRGSLMPAMAIGLLVAGGCLALVLNQLWLSTSQDELRTTAAAAALAAAQQLTSDELLRPDYDPPQLADEARTAAQQMAQSATGTRIPPKLAVRLGRVVVDPETGWQQTLETDYGPTSVLVIAHRERRSGNPIPLIAPFLTGRGDADLTVSAEASISNLVRGVRPIASACVPAWPLAVLESSIDPELPTWQRDIEQRQGADNYRWDEASRRVVEEADGLPEILLRPQSENGAGNLRIVDLGSGLADDILFRQFTEGWCETDLAAAGGEICPAERPLPLASSDDFSGMPEQVLQEQIGQSRLLLLYEELPADASTGTTALTATRLVAGRIMAVRQNDAGLEVVLQPAVIATRMALLDEEALYREDAPGNPYLYKLSLTQ